ncbi:hypothetical protein E0H46_28770 [Rhizobium leguminosarum bv. viciae]|nr:hypothetical protein E0H46_28770 [Rhizobium leguminosarum bv. viciae]
MNKTLGYGMLAVLVAIGGAYIYISRQTEGFSAEPGIAVAAEKQHEHEVYVLRTVYYLRKGLGFCSKKAKDKSYREAQAYATKVERETALTLDVVERDDALALAIADAEKRWMKEGHNWEKMCLPETFANYRFNIDFALKSK